MFRGVGASKTRWALTVSAMVAGFSAATAIGQINSATSSDPGYPPPYDNSNADRELKAFDEGHPQCALWTDWHKLCSRTGIGGSTYCRTDAEHPANPSTPFCAKGTNGYAPDQHMSGAERKSSARFISNYVERRWTESGGTDGTPEITKHGRYPIFDPSRPFAGRTLAQLEHPYCAVWLVQSDDGQQTRCAEDDRKGLPSCKDPTIRYKVSAKTYPVCVEKIRDRICNRDDPSELNTISDVAGNTYNIPEVVGYRHIDAPVIGYSCPFEVKK